MSILSDMSTREKNLWAELVVDIVVAVYYFPKMLHLIASDERYLAASAMAGLIVKTVVLAIVVGIVVSILLRIWQNPEKDDERDYQFSARGALISNRVLTICVMLIIGQLAFEGLFPGIAALRSITIPPLMVAHLLLLSLIFSSAIKSVAQLFFYRRGY